MDTIKLNNPFCGLSEEEIRNTGVSTSFAAFNNEGLWKAMEVCFNVRDWETLVSIEIKDSGIEAHFKTK